MSKDKKKKLHEDVNEVTEVADITSPIIADILLSS